jgi:hypothetical protein
MTGTWRVGAYLKTAEVDVGALLEAGEDLVGVLLELVLDVHLAALGVVLFPGQGVRDAATPQQTKTTRALDG